MKLCVIGDSWAGIDPYKELIINLLSQAGHSVINLAHGGASNHGQLQNLQYELLEKDKVDYIIWFHTEPVRDYTEFISMTYSFDNIPSPYFSDIGKKNLVEDLHFLNTQNYQYAQDLYEQYHTPFLVIGSAAPLSPSIENFSFFRYKIDSWNKQISGFEDMPLNCYTHHMVRMLTHNNEYKSQQALDELQKTDKLEIFMRSDKQKYPDTSHPNTCFYPDLIDNILNFLKDQQGSLEYVDSLVQAKIP